MAIYNKYYQEENYFGNPYPEMLAFMDGLDRDKKVLDIGCGQGRDILALGRMGFTCLGIDISSVGISQLNTIAQKENIPVKGIVADMNVFEDISDYDVIILDSMLHFYKKDQKKESSFLLSILKQMKQNSLLMIFIPKHRERVTSLRNVINESEFELHYVEDKTILFHEFNTKYEFIVIEKT